MYQNLYGICTTHLEYCQWVTLNNDTRSSTNENFRFWCQFLKRHEITVDLLRADRVGLWQLHLDAMQRALYEFAALDSTNYLLWGTMCLEDARSLSETAPFVYRSFMEGQSFSIKNKPGRFSTVGGDRSLSRPSISRQSAVMV